ncbi:JAB domain-containing protein [Aminipila sp.]|uniref:JAB domain-containing protein n=1 Tax=Aminipila sp. TaxID=2060095 RepID=UPI00289D3C8B|nr:JAB domain-containing protein [Aminipila sp.]
MEHKKRVDIVKLEMVKEASLKYMKRVVTNPLEVGELIRDFIGNPDREVFGILCLDTKGQPTHLSKVAIGDLNCAIVHPREVFKIAILSNAASVILFHNHPSGVEFPSEEDKRITNRLKESGDILGITILDHIIMGDANCFSFRSKQLL